ncbi:MAG TPA: N-acetylglucosamine-6-phosphate deacetylase [Actinomycetes bacterium]|jgi:N-acetylglucosamine-6-phosphate deacetylase|nr:N-acetylglucosamine-6-phosphate deacetylase [Actinomycetes bacterium]
MITLLAGARVVRPAGVLDPGWVEVAGDRIAAVGSGGIPTGLTVVPGFVDIHVHGGGGASFLSADPDEAARAVAFHRRRGTTTTLASLVTAPLDILERQLSALADVCADGLLAGIHLEGPWLSDVRRGAHDKAFLRPPALPEVRRLLAAGGSALRIVTLAPELDGGLEAVRAVVAAGAVAAVGHTDATYEMARASIDAGARLGTHLFNGMRPVHHREPGAVVALLEDDRVAVELVNDGTHLHPAIVRGVVGAAGPDRVALVTDAIAGAGMGDGEYDLGGLRVQVGGGVPRLASTGSIAGSTLTMDAAFRRAVVDTRLPLEVAARLTSATPARVLGLDDVGAIEPGWRADMVVLDEKLEVVAVMARGVWVDGPPRCLSR